MVLNPLLIFLNCHKIRCFVGIISSILIERYSLKTSIIPLENQEVGVEWMKLSGSVDESKNSDDQP